MEIVGESSRGCFHAVISALGVQMFYYFLLPLRFEPLGKLVMHQLVRKVGPRHIISDAKTRGEMSAANIVIRACLLYELKLDFRSSSGHLYGISSSSCKVITLRKSGSRSFKRRGLQINDASG